MSVTINTFPPLHAFTSSRSWFLAFIVLLHIGFFWVLTNGLSIGDFTKERPGTVVLVPEPPRPVKPERTYEGPVVDHPIYVPKPERPELEVAEDPQSSAPRSVTDDPGQAAGPGAGASVAPPEPVMVGPEIDHRIGLSEPVYPIHEIRMQHTGTVVLSVQVLANGRVGEVRLERSSGYRALDESAMREARRWRLIPGTRDGVPAVMWKQIPITFRLRD